MRDGHWVVESLDSACAYEFLFVPLGMKLVAALVQIAVKVNVELDNTQVRKYSILYTV